MNKNIIVSTLLSLFCPIIMAQTEAPKPHTKEESQSKENPQTSSAKCAVAPKTNSSNPQTSSAKRAVAPKTDSSNPQTSSAKRAVAPKTPPSFLILPSSPNILYTGRIQNSNPNRSTFTYPGIEIRTAFTGNHISMIAKPHSGYFMVKIDDSDPFKIAFLNDSIHTIYDAQAPDHEAPTSHNETSHPNKSTSPKVESPKTHQLTITYVGEGYQTLPEFHGFLLNQTTTLTTPSSLPSRKIEFIGNSITCGYGIEANVPSAPYSEETANYYYTYAAQTARNLKAQATVLARSGIGVYRNYNGPQTGDAINMNTEYPYTLLYNDKYQWDFTRFTPDVVCINLGTNDTSTTGADSTLLTQGFINLYKQVRSHYSQAKIILLSGCMMQGDALSMAKQAMDNTLIFAKEHGDSQVYRLDFPPHDGSLGYGASWHPSMKQHAKMADQLTAYLKKIMNW